MLSTKISRFILSLIIATIATFSCSVVLADHVEDAAITAEVKSRLMSERDIPHNNIEVSTLDRIVTLRGNIDTTLQAHQAVEIASSVDKVVDVIDTYLKVKRSDSFMSDALITAKVKGKIRHLYTSKQIADGYDLHVETTNQVVHIRGTVANSADMDTVINAVKGVKGVKSVKTNIK